MNEVSKTMPTTVTGSPDNKGPKGIGVLDRPFVEVNTLEMRGHLIDASMVLKKKHGEKVFQNDLGNLLREDFKNLAVKPNGSHIFIADGDVTIAMMKHQNGLLVEIRKPGQPYIRGFVFDKRQLAEAMDLTALITEA